MRYRSVLVFGERRQGRVAGGDVPAGTVGIQHILAAEIPVRPALGAHLVIGLFPLLNHHVILNNLRVIEPLEHLLLEE